MSSGLLSLAAFSGMKKFYRNDRNKESIRFREPRTVNFVSSSSRTCPNIYAPVATHVRSAERPIFNIKGLGIERGEQSCVQMHTETIFD